MIILVNHAVIISSITDHNIVASLYALIRNPYVSLADQIFLAVSESHIAWGECINSRSAYAVDNLVVSIFCLVVVCTISKYKYHKNMILPYTITSAPRATQKNLPNESNKSGLTPNTTIAAVHQKKTTKCNKLNFCL